MRIVAGTAGGIGLKSPPGDTIRPTSDMVRDAVFNVLTPHLAEAVILDLYAGTGAMGIEGLSRGAQMAEFVDSSPVARSIIRDNLKGTGLTSKGLVTPGRLPEALSRVQACADIAILDPPYAADEIHRTMDALATGPTVQPTAILVLEHSKRFTPLPRYGNFTLGRSKRYGDTVISYFGTPDDDSC
jgi:16S rRNA (guanine966-N2)-methyltransferase